MRKVPSISGYDPLIMGNQKRQSKKNRQSRDQKEKDKGANNGRQNSTQKTKNLAT
jgi:hypothetical protein